MVETIDELKKITQKPGGERGNWMVRKITRNQAIYITWLLLHTPISADGVVLLSILCALAGGFCLSLGTGATFVLGAFFLHLWYIFDHVDGQVARYRKQTNITGIFFDYIVHYIVNFTVALGLSLGCYRATSNPAFLLWGMLFAVSITMFNAISDVRAKSFITNMIREGKTVQINIERIYPASAANQSATGAAAMLKRGLSLCHKICEIHVMLNVILAAALIQWITRFNLMTILVVSYSLALTALWILKVTKIILNKKIDADYKDFFAGQG